MRPKRHEWDDEDASAWGDVASPAGDAGATVGDGTVGTVTIARPEGSGDQQQAVPPSPEYPGKRLIDVVVALVVLTLSAPLLFLIWCSVVLTSRGPGLYWSERVGKDGRLFRMPKFRTMVCNAPEGPREALTNADALITPLGAVLRRTSLDELPQLWCVLKGDMSLIGPRPLLPSDPAVKARLDYPEISRVRPGISGFAQVSGRNNVTPEFKAKLDAHYARAVSWRMDAQVIVRTLIILVTGHGFV